MKIESRVRTLLAVAGALALALLAGACSAQAEIDEVTTAAQPTAPLATTPEQAANPEPEPTATVAPAPTATPIPDPPTPTATPTPQPVTETEGAATTTADINTAELAWIWSSIVDYEYTLHRSCECDDSVRAPRRIRVERGVVVEAMADGEPSPHGGFTVDELHRQARTALLRGEQVAASFDGNGVPTSGVIDVEATWVDGGFAYEISDFTVVREGAPVDDAYLTALGQWRNADVGSYFLAYAPLCFCPPAELQVIVTDGTVTDTINVAAGEDESWPRDGLTVDEMFVEIRNAIVGGAASVEVDYHPTSGWPTSFFIDVDERIADEEWGLEVQTLEPFTWDGEPDEQIAFCTAFDELVSIDDTPPTPELARQNLDAMLEAVESVVASAPPELEAGAVEMRRLVEAVYRLAEAANWEPAFFEGLEEDVLVNEGIDAELLNGLFDAVDESCGAPTVTVEVEPTD